MSRNTIDIIQAIAVILTLLVLVKYTYETYKLRRETEKQTELSQRPFIIIGYTPHEATFKLTNLGHGIALNVKIDDVCLVREGPVKLSYIFPQIKIIPPDKECEIKDIKIDANGESRIADTFDLGALFPESAVRAFDVTIRYNNLLGNGYITSGKLGQETFDFETIEKVGEGTTNIWRSFERRDRALIKLLSKKGKR